MAKRFTDTTIWKNQRWFKKLSPIHKLAWKYITDMCDHAGILKIDFSEFTDDIGVEEFDIKDFIKHCNTDFDKETGKRVERERIKLVKINVVWITGFIKFQYEPKELVINPKIPAIYSALTILNGYNLLDEGLTKGYFTLNQPYIKGMLRAKDKDKDKDTLTVKKEGIIPDQKSSLFRQPIIPTKKEVWEVFSRNGATKEMARAFYEKYEGVGWFASNSPVTNFTPLANKFIENWRRNENKKTNGAAAVNTAVKIIRD